MVVDPILLVFSIVLVILMMVGNLYFLAYYSHALDTGFGNSLITKVLLVRLASNLGAWLPACGSINSYAWPGCAKYVDQRRHLDDPVLVHYFDDSARIPDTGAPSRPVPLGRRR
jgi:hypothetical protein